MAPGADIGMEFSFSAALVEWRGPAPYHFLPLPEGASEAIGEVAGALTYGWGVIPVTAVVCVGASSYPRTLLIGSIVGASFTALTVIANDRG